MAGRPIGYRLGYKQREAPSEPWIQFCTPFFVSYNSDSSLLEITRRSGYDAMQSPPVSKQ